MKEAIKLSLILLAIVTLFSGLLVFINVQNNNAYRECLHTQERISNILVVSRDGKDSFHTYSIPDCRR